MRRLLAAAVLLAAAGCAPAPADVPGRAAPVTRPAGPATPATPTTSRPAPVATPSGTPTPPAAYATYRLERLGVAVELPVPTDWSLTRTERGVNFGDPTGTVLLQVNLVPRAEPSAIAEWTAAEAGFRRTLAGYRRLDLVDVPGLGDGAADLTFTFVGNEVTRQVLDRGIVVGDTWLALYYSAPQQWYDRMRPVFDRAARDLRLP